MTARPLATWVPSVSAWKVEPPRLAEPLLSRDRLLTRIEQALGKQRSTGDVFLVSAPAGYGKTTMLAQWAASASIPVAWYHLDAGDADPAVLLTGLVHALREHLPQSRWSVERLLTHVREGTLAPGEVRRAAQIIIAGLAEQVRRPLALVLTGASELPPESGAHLLLDRLLARPPDLLRVVLEAREAPRLRLSPLLAQRRLDGLGAEELRLRDDELSALLALHQVLLTSSEVEALQALSDGWVTGVLLATDALLPNCIPSCLTPDFNREAVFDYLASEVIEALPPQLSAFATQASVLRSMTASLCAELLECGEARALLGALEKRTGFVTRVGRRPEDLVYRFLPLLRQALLDRLAAEEHGPTRRRALHLRAGDLLRERGDDEEAAHHYAEAGGYERLVALIEARHGSLLRAGRGATLARWLDMLPVVVRAEQPHLQVLLAELHRQAGRLDEARDAAERACKACRPLMDREPALMARALVVRAQGRFAQGHYSEARDDCADAMRITPDEADETFVRAAFTLAGCVQALSGPQAALTALSGIEERATRRRDLWALARLHYLRSKLAIAQGHYVEAEHEANAALHYAQEDGDEVDAINSHINLGMIKRVTERPREARQELEAAHAQAEAAGYALGVAYALTNLADLELDQRQYRRALKAFQQANQAAEVIQESQLQAYARAGMGYALVLVGQVARATDLLNPLLAECASDDRALEWLAYALPAAFACHRTGRLSDAIELLSRASNCAQAYDAGADLARAQLQLAAVYLTQHHQAGVNEALRSALDAAGRADGLSALLTEACRLPELWPYLRTLSHPLADELSVKLVRSESELAITTHPVPEPAASALRAFAFGDERVLVGIDRVTRWRMPRARELLFFLLDRNEPVRKEAVLDALWPEKASETAENAFRQARFQLKQALGQNCLAQHDGRWYIAGDVWLDVREFERLAADGERLSTCGELSRAAATIRQALTYYTGPYLADTYRDWPVTRRDELARCHLACLERLAVLELRLGHPGSAAQLYYQVLDIEPHRESAHRGLMTYFAGRGEPAEALSQFKRCAATLERDLGVAPSSKTLALAQAIHTRIQNGAQAFSEMYSKAGSTSR
jgi:ATP/maltotriose-dependent transcriptional regulator MalT/DNA-binding SARP family transcriptional activator